MCRTARAAARPPDGAPPYSVMPVEAVAEASAILATSRRMASPWIAMTGPTLSFVLAVCHACDKRSGGGVSPKRATSPARSRRATPQTDIVEKGRLPHCPAADETSSGLVGSSRGRRDPNRRPRSAPTTAYPAAPALVTSCCAVRRTPQQCNACRPGLRRRHHGWHRAGAPCDKRHAARGAA